MYTPRGRWFGTLAVLAPVALLWAVPVDAEASVRLLDEELHPPELAFIAQGRGSVPDLSLPSSRRWGRLVASGGAAAPERGDDSRGGEDEAEKKPEGHPVAAPPPGSHEFDLLGEPAKAERVDEGALRLRRTMLNLHQGVGLGMFALQLATTVVGQLNYNDKFGGDNTAKYVQPHAILAYSTLATFVAAGTLALLAPSPLRKSEGFDRVSLHKLAMYGAAAGMLAQGILGVVTKSREGYQNQKSIATAHLVVGYVTFAAVATGVGALIF
jgi:hypothetical protein